MNRRILSIDRAPRPQRGLDPLADRARAFAVETRPLTDEDRAATIRLARKLHLPVCPILQTWAELDAAQKAA